MSKSTLDRRKKDIDRWKSVGPSYNGWWYYQYFIDSFNKREGMKKI